MDTARVANAIVEEEVEAAIAAGTLRRPWQYFAVLLPVRTVGVMGDNRVYGEAVSVRIVESNDAMTGTAADPPVDSAGGSPSGSRGPSPEASTRVLYDITDKPPATIEWE